MVAIYTYLVLTLNNKGTAINLDSFLPYKMAASFRHVIILIVPRPVIKPVYIDGFNYRTWHYKNYHVTKTGSHFVGQKGNQINSVSLVIQR